MSQKRRFRILALLLALTLLAALALPLGAHAQGEKKIVRVGWYESPFNTTDALGRRSGYAYDYQQKLAAYTGWTYEYVEGSWPELLQMLIDGRIDLLSDVSWTPERAEKILYSALPMGAEEYYLFVSPGNREITPEDYSTFSGKKIGANKGSVQIGFFRQWAEANGVEAELVELTGTEEENVTKLTLGGIDVYVSLDGLPDSRYAVPVCKIGASDFYFAVSSSRPELLTELNQAMNRVRDEIPFLSHELSEKYLETAGVNRFLSAEEETWLENHGTIRVGYRDNYLAFCARDAETGELTGALKDYLETAADCLSNAHLDFEALPFPTAEDAMAAMKRGEVDCVFPANLTGYDGELQGVFITPALMRTDMSAVIRASDRDSFSKKERVVVAVNIGNPNYDIFLLDHFPDWRAIYYDTTPDCLKAVADGQADCLLISHYRFNNISELCEKYKLTTVSTGVAMDDCFAVNREDTTLYSILTKTTGAVPASTVNAALTHYFTEDAKVSLMDLVKRNINLVAGALFLVIVVFLFAVLRGVRAEKKATDARQLISETETDALTGLYNRDYFYTYVDRMVRAHPARAMDAVALDIEQLQSLAALNGPSFSDRLLQTLGEELKRFADESGGIAGREEAGRFALFCPPAEDYRSLHNQLQGILDVLSPNVGVRLRMGVMPWQADTEPYRLFEHARAACAMAGGAFEERVIVVDEKLREREAYEQRLVHDLGRAIQNRELKVYYQPKLDIRGDMPVLTGAEALVRWNHPELGMILPGDFVPLLEKDGEIAAVDQFVWAETARRIADWKARFGVSLPISVNLSRVDLFDPALTGTLDRLREKNGLAPDELRLEVTEAACSENEYRLVYVVESLRKKGYRIELDDFGTGAASLNILSSLSVDALKINRAFIGSLEGEEKKRQFAELILDIARYLKVPAVAVGVETEAQFKLLRDLGCDQAQGYRFSCPLPAAEFEEKYLSRKQPDGEK